MSTHTSTPWFTVPGQRDEAIAITATAGVPVADCWWQSSTQDANANSAHIVRCVNAHDELVAALRTLVDRNLCYENGKIDRGQITFAEVQDARAVLAKLEAS